jgi:hypothetical protein
MGVPLTHSSIHWVLTAAEAEPTLHEVLSGVMFHIILISEMLLTN